MRKKTGRARRRKKKNSASLAKIWNRILIAATLGAIAAYFIPFTARVIEDSPDGLAYSDDHRPEDVTVRVLNGCGVNGLARQTTGELRALGFDVLEVANVPKVNNEDPEYETTVITALSEDRRAAVMVRDALGVGRLVYAPDPSEMLDVSVTLGKDYANLSGRSEGR